jgi:hypothetical protein
LIDNFFSLCFSSYLLFWYVELSFIVCNGQHIRACNYTLDRTLVKAH